MKQLLCAALVALAFGSPTALAQKETSRDDTIYPVSDSFRVGPYDIIDGVINLELVAMAVDVKDVTLLSDCLSIGIMNETVCDTFKTNRTYIGGQIDTKITELNNNLSDGYNSGRHQQYHRELYELATRMKIIRDTSTRH